MRPDGRRGVVAALLVLLALAGCALAGCARKAAKPAPTGPLSGPDVAKVIDDQLPRTFGGLRVGPAACPATLDPQQDCLARPTHGATVRLVVTIQDRKGNFTFEEAK